MRRWTAEVLPLLGADLLDDVVMVVNELVANAYDHTVTLARLHVLVTDGQVRVAVEGGSVNSTAVWAWTSASVANGKRSRRSPRP
ncbi:hypothetical protein AB0H12_41980 [Actinosynnema sp. NPDC023794]